MAGLGVLCHHPGGPDAGLRWSAWRRLISTFHTPGNGSWRLRPLSQSRGGIRLRASLLQPGASSSAGARTLSSVAHWSFISCSSKQVLRAQVTSAVFCEDLLKYSRLGAFSLCRILLPWASGANELTPLAGITLSSSALQVPRALFIGLVLCVIRLQSCFSPSPGWRLCLLLPWVLCNVPGAGEG